MKIVIPNTSGLNVVDNNFEPKYFSKNKLRFVTPYVYTYKLFSKKRWMGKKIADVLTSEFCAYDLSYFLESIRKGYIKVNSKTVNSDYIIKSNDFIEHKLLLFEKPVICNKVLILYEDDNFICVYKDASIPTHPVGSYQYNSLLRILQNYISSSVKGVITREHNAEGENEQDGEGKGKQDGEGKGKQDEEGNGEQDGEGKIEHDVIRINFNFKKANFPPVYQETPQGVNNLEGTSKIWSQKVEMRNIAYGGRVGETAESGVDEMGKLGNADIEVGVPGNADIEVDEPGSADIEVGVPGNADIEVGVPGNADIEVDEPGSADIEVGVPGNADIEVGVPGNADIEVDEPGSADIEVGVPGNADIEVGVPGNADIEVDEPGSADIEVGVPGNADIEVGVPGNADIEVDEPGSADIEVGVPGNADIEVGVPGNADIEVDEPGSADIEVGEPVITFAEVDNRKKRKKNQNYLNELDKNKAKMVRNSSGDDVKEGGTIPENVTETIDEGDRESTLRERLPQSHTCDENLPRDPKLNKRNEKSSCGQGDGKIHGREETAHMYGKKIRRAKNNEKDSNKNEDYNNGKDDEGDRGNSYIYTLHRLDKLTSGIVLFGKNKRFSTFFSQNISNNKIRKSYITRVEGDFRTLIKKLQSEGKILQPSGEVASCTATLSAGTPSIDNADELIARFCCGSREGDCPQFNDVHCFKNDIFLCENEYGKSDHHLTNTFMTNLVSIIRKNKKHLNDLFDIGKFGIEEKDFDVDGCLEKKSFPKGCDNFDEYYKYYVIDFGYMYCENKKLLKYVFTKYTKSNYRIANEYTLKPSVTRFMFLSYNSSLNESLVLCQPITGRTHQIRAHLKSLSFPISNDAQYNKMFEEEYMNKSRYVYFDDCVGIKCGDKDGTRGAEDGTCGAEDGTCGAEDGTCGDKDGTCGDKDGTCSDKDGKCGDKDGTRGDKDGTRGDKDGTRGDKDGTRGSEDRKNNNVDYLKGGQSEEKTKNRDISEKYSYFPLIPFLNTSFNWLYDENINLNDTYTEEVLNNYFFKKISNITYHSSGIFLHSFRYTWEGIFDVFTLLPKWCHSFYLPKNIIAFLLYGSLS
ncbi:pseudouridylate synthase, putative [Plasmodium ovale]|uniref:Pseudouridylate synthase, putative n=1 Tax=Plasmodium ovale TaxID=36330 RepID=A0A1D3U7Q2_PLAOA|nr:pseudouridylate synthase, putative [Plasmodium ovale]